MIFIYSKWEKFCGLLSCNGHLCIPANEVNKANFRYIVLKHDVETDVSSALHIAKIEHKYGLRGSYYVQANLLNSANNVDMLKQIQAMGHEVSYHYDVMDSNSGNIESAILEFENNVSLFCSHGFEVRTLCQHGNPVIERVGYTSNRDFFRSERVNALYPELSDIMVNFKEKFETDYLYFSDAGRHFQFVFDPINNDLANSDDKNILYNSLDSLYSALSNEKGNIISIHPHRWTKSPVIYIFKALVFKIVKSVAKMLIRIPFMKKVMSKYYYLAKKI